MYKNIPREEARRLWGVAQLWDAFLKKKKNRQKELEQT